MRNHSRTNSTNADSFRRLEVITGFGRRRRWTDEEKARIVAESLILLDLPTYSPWLNPIEMLWRHSRREVTHCELFDNIEAMLEATRDFFDRINRKVSGVW